VSTHITLDDIRRAWDSRDPDLVDLIDRLSRQDDIEPETPVREGALTFDKFIQEITTKEFHRKPREEQQHYRVETIRALESEDAEVPLVDRFKLHSILLTLWEDNGPFARTCLLKIIAEVCLTYGPWRALKRVFKEAEQRGDTEVLGALAARFDMAYAGAQSLVSKATLGYLCRRAWRFLRRTAQTLPACYADFATDFLSQYGDHTNWTGTWIANHIFYHDTKAYNARSFRFERGSPPSNLLNHRAFEDLWRRSPRPLFSLLERARSNRVRLFATEALKADFRAVLRDVEPAWVSRLVTVDNNVIDDFVVWILENVPRFEQADFRELQLHETVLRLFDSKSNGAREYAARYARTHARDLPVEDLVRLANNGHEAVRKLAEDLLTSRDPRKEVGLEAWGQLLESNHCHKLAADALRKHFGANELTPNWFKARLLSHSEPSRRFAYDNLMKLHSADQLGAGYFCEVIDASDVDDERFSDWHEIVEFAMTRLEDHDINELDPEFLKRLFVNPFTRATILGWIDEGRFDMRQLPVEFYKSLVYHPAFETDLWISELKQNGKDWTRDLSFEEESLAEPLREWLSDSRRFSAQQLGVDWLLELSERSEALYHMFAEDVMIRGFAPADFATAESTPEAGCQRLWDMITKSKKGDEPLARFALKYFRKHHSEIHQDETGQKLTAGMEIPATFVTFERVKPLFFDQRKPLRDFALHLAKFDFGRWSPPLESLVELCEAPNDEVREFVAQALLSDDEPEHRRYRIDPAVLTPDAVYSFCESKDAATRTLGMRLIEKHTRLQLPEHLFRLTESPDRKVRAFVIRAIWSMYRDRGITDNWKPNDPPQTTIGDAAKKKAEEAAKNRGEGARPRPEQLPSNRQDLNDFLRRILFEIPPAKLEKTKGISDTIKTRLIPLSARKAKLALIEVIRDLAFEDSQFAKIILPLLDEFMGSRGQSEQAACLVAVTRIRHAHPSPLAEETKT